MKVYSARDVAKLLDLTVSQVRSYARASLVKPDRGARGEYRFSFQDLVLLRTTKGLVASRIPPRQVRRVLRKLKQQLPTGRPLSGVQILAAGDRIVVRDGTTLWNPESGQALFDFDVRELARKVAPHTRRALERVEEQYERDLDAEDWYTLGTDLEAAAPEQARDAYRRTLEIAPRRVDARINLARLLQEAGRTAAAEAQYRLVLELHPREPTALFNLGVCLEDGQRYDEALAAYDQSIQADPGCADAHFNAARLCERAGDTAGALRHLKAYRQLTQGT